MPTDNEASPRQRRLHPVSGGSAPYAQRRLRPVGGGFAPSRGMQGNSAPIPMPSDTVRTWNQAAADAVWHRTGVDVACMGRKQSGGTKEMTASGPIAKLEEALDLAKAYLRGEAELPPLVGAEAQRLREEHQAARENRRAPRRPPPRRRSFDPRPRREASPAHQAPRPRREASPAHHAPRPRREDSRTRREAPPANRGVPSRGPACEVSPSPRRRWRRRSPTSDSTSSSALTNQQEAAPAATFIKKTNNMAYNLTIINIF